jgi:hypothetical protein
MHRSDALAFYLAAFVAVISPISCHAETFDNSRTPIATTTGGLECEPFPVIIRSARPPVSVLVPRGGIGPKKPMTTKTAKSSPASSNSSKMKSTIVEIPAFFRTKTALSVLGTSMLGFGVPMILAPAWVHKTLFVPELDEMGRAYMLLTAIRETAVGAVCYVLANQASEEVRRWYLAIVTVCLVPFQVHLMLTKSLFHQYLSLPMLLVQLFYCLYLPLSAYLSFIQDDGK